MALECELSVLRRRMQVKRRWPQSHRVLRNNPLPLRGRVRVGVDSRASDTVSNCVLRRPLIPCVRRSRRGTPCGRPRRRDSFTLGRPRGQGAHKGRPYTNCVTPIRIQTELPPTDFAIAPQLLAVGRAAALCLEYRNPALLTWSRAMGSSATMLVIGIVLILLGLFVQSNIFETLLDIIGWIVVIIGAITIVVGIVGLFGNRNRADRF